MATKFRLKRSATADKRPIQSDLLLGELALNTYDGRLYTKRDTNNVGIADTAALLTPWTENFGGGSIHYGNSVGIGTTNPQANLEVAGTTHYQLIIKDSNNLGNAAQAALAFRGSDDADLGLVGLTSWEHGDIMLQSSTSGKNIRFQTHNGTAIRERVRITSIGRVGIGSEIPDYMLDVSGAINSETDVKVGGVSVSETALNDAVAMAIALG